MKIHLKFSVFCFCTDIPVDLDNLLIHLRVPLTPKWKEFGLYVGIEEDVLNMYSSHPPEECIVEVLDYWLSKLP